MKNVILILVFLFICVQACNNIDNPVQSQTFIDTSISVSAWKDSIFYKLTIPEDSISLQDTLKGSFLLINQAKTKRMIISPDSPIFQWELKDSSGNWVMRDGPSHHNVFNRTLNPSDSLIFIINRKIPNLSLGQYTLDASLYYPKPVSPVLSLKIVLL